MLKNVFGNPLLSHNLPVRLMFSVWGFNLKKHFKYSVKLDVVYGLRILRIIYMLVNPKEFFSAKTIFTENDVSANKKIHIWQAIKIFPNDVQLM